MQSRENDGSEEHNREEASQRADDDKSRFEVVKITA